MMRVRDHGWVVPRHNAGMLRAVRGQLYLRDVLFPDLRRHVRVAEFHVKEGQLLTLMDAMLMHASPDRLVLSGFERVLVGMKETDFAQTWVLVECEGHEPVATRGPPFVR